MNKIKNTKKQKTTIIVIVLIIIIATILSILLLNKKKNDINKYVENDNERITITKLAKTDDYLIIEYDVDIKSKQQESYNKEKESTYTINRKIKSNGENIENGANKENQISYKESDNKIKVYDIINISNKTISDKIEIDIYNLENTSEDNIEAEEMPNEENNEEMQDEENTYENQEEVIDEQFDMTEEFDEEEYLEQEKIEQEQYKDGIEFEEQYKIATLEIEVEKIEKAETIEDKQTYELENQTIEMNIKEIIKTSFGKFLIIETNLKNISSDKMEENSLDDPTMFSLNIQDENGNTIAANKTEYITIYQADQNKWNGIDKLENGIAQITTTLALVGENKDLEKIKLQPYYLRIEQNEENQENRQWNKLDNKTYTSRNSNGGTVEITQIEEKERKIIFHYKTTGFISEKDAIIVIRNVYKEGNYATPSKIQIKSNKEYIAEFELEGDEIEEDNKYLDAKENLEFTIFENKDEKVLKENLEVEI